MIVAPADGGVLDGDVDSMLGRYVEAGQTVCSLGSGQQKKVLAMISQENLRTFQRNLERPVSVHVWGNGSTVTVGNVKNLAPRGQTDVIHPAFAATNGGPLEVFLSPNQSSEDNFSQNSSSGVQLTTPHFLAEVQVEPEVLEPLRSGQLGTAFFRTNVGSTGTVLRESAIQWWLARQNALRRQWQ